MHTRDVLTGAGIGMAVAFMFDPAGGRRRRTLARDKATRATRITRDGLDATARDIGHRARGMAAAARGRFPGQRVSDQKIGERIRAKLGRVCSNPRAIDVAVADGAATLRGAILAHEMDAVLAAAGAVRGVQRVFNELDPHETAGTDPSLQGYRRASRTRFDLRHRSWAPAAQALVTATVVATGMCVAAYARRNRPGADTEPARAH
jgi:hypothetical protein